MLIRLRPYTKSILAARIMASGFWSPPLHFNPQVSQVNSKATGL